MLRVLALALGAVLAVPGAPALVAQTPSTPPTWEAVMARQWVDLHDRLLAMAQDTAFPDDKLGWRPHPDSRTVLEEFRHVTIGLEMSSAQLQGKPFDYYAREKADLAKPKTRASVVAEMEAALAVSYPLVKGQAKPVLTMWIEHQGEHYGKLVSNYRMIGIVPPVSRK
ncbi:MAG: DinB family protein [Vicinamibacterales bacterium]